MLACTPPGCRLWSHLTKEFISCASQWDPTVSIRKTQAMATNSPNPSECLSLFPNVSVRVVDEFPYLGSVISGPGSLDKEVSSRLSKASRAFGSLLNPIFLCFNLSIATKRIVHRAVVFPSLLYGSETWAVKACHILRLEIFHRSCIFAILGISGTAVIFGTCAEVWHVAEHGGSSLSTLYALAWSRCRYGHWPGSETDRLW